jgi:hypothetical protein
VLGGLLAGCDLVVLLRDGVDPIWAWIQVPVIGFGVIAPVAWAQRRWLLAGAALLGTLGGLWGYFYVPPLAALALAMVAFSRAAQAHRRPVATSA